MKSANLIAFRIVAPLILIGDAFFISHRAGPVNLVYFGNAIVIAAAWMLWECKAAGFLREAKQIGTGLKGKGTDEQRPRGQAHRRTE